MEGQPAKIQDFMCRSPKQVLSSRSLITNTVWTGNRDSAGLAAVVTSSAISCCYTTMMQEEGSSTSHQLKWPKTARLVPEMHYRFSLCKEETHRHQEFY